MLVCWNQFGEDVSPIHDISFTLFTRLGTTESLLITNRKLAYVSQRSISTTNKYSLVIRQVEAYVVHREVQWAISAFFTEILSRNSDYSTTTMHLVTSGKGIPIHHLEYTVTTPVF